MYSGVRVPIFFQPPFLCLPSPRRSHLGIARNGHFYVASHHSHGAGLHQFSGRRPERVLRGLPHSGNTLTLSTVGVYLALPLLRLDPVLSYAYITFRGLLGFKP